MRSGASTNGVPCEPLAARAREEAGAVLQSASERHCRTHQKRRLARNVTNVTGFPLHKIKKKRLLIISFGRRRSERRYLRM